MGVINSSVIYTASIVCCLFLPKYVISILGHKWTIVVSFSGYLTWMVANGYATWATMVPSSALLGVCMTLAFTAQSSYVTAIAERYAEIGGEKRNVVVARFFGIFYFFFQMSKLVSQISSHVLCLVSQIEIVNVSNT